MNTLERMALKRAAELCRLSHHAAIGIAVKEGQQKEPLMININRNDDPAHEITSNISEAEQWINAVLENK